MTCPNCDCPMDDDSERTYVRCGFCGHISYNPGWNEEDDECDGTSAGRSATPGTSPRAAITSVADAGCIAIGHTGSTAPKARSTATPATLSTGSGDGGMLGSVGGGSKTTTFRFSAPRGTDEGGTA